MGLLASRKATKKKMDAEPDPFKKALYDGLQLAYKVTANSVYGQIGARTSKIYKPQIAASTTAGGRLRIRHAQAFLSEKFPGTTVVYGETDSAFFKFTLVNPDGTAPTTDKEKIQLAIEKGQLAEKELKKVLPGVHCMAYEKVLFPFILISKKRYFALKYEDDPTKYKQISMGLILKRRDNAPILKHCYIGVLGFTHYLILLKPHYIQ
jgi:DNA polymerase delta subunit 1